MVGLRARGFLLASLLISVAAAGCLSGGNNTTDPDSVLVPDTAPDLNATTNEVVWPECHLVPGSITWPPLADIPETPSETPITLRTDAYGVTHVYADDLYSLFYGNGYVQARDRLFQMDVLRQVGYGTSSEYLGPSYLAMDESIHRTMYTLEELQAQLDAAPKQVVDSLQAYSDGVNQWMLEAPARDMWPVEFGALGRVPPQWTPLDTVATINYLIGYFGNAGGSELDNLRRVHQLQTTLGQSTGYEALEDWVWLRADDTYTSISADDLVLNGCEEPLPFDDVGHQLASAKDARLTQVFGVPERQGSAGPTAGGRSYFEPVDRGPLESFEWGSNALLIDGSLTNTGKPIMWGAPQMSYYKPPVPYQIGLHAPEAGFDAVGIGVAGAPGLVIGRNADLAWTATSGIEDLIDMVEIELTGTHSYLWDGVEKEMDCWVVEHTLQPTATYNEPPTTYEQEVCRAEGWPVVAINGQAGLAYLQKTSTRHKELMGAAIWLQAPTTSSIDEFRTLVGDFPFTFNFLVAADDGIAQIHTGAAPIRAGGYDPRLPTPSGSAYEWKGIAYTQEMQTWITDPSSGYIANWNNAPVHGWRTGDTAGLWGPTGRVEQIDNWVQFELDKDGSITLEDVQAINWNSAIHDSYALAFMPYLIDAAATDPSLDGIHDALVSWTEAGVPWRDANNDGLYDDPAHAIWDSMFQQMFNQITGDELGSLTKEVTLEPAPADNNKDHGTYDNDLGPILKMLQGNTNHNWCDIVETQDEETCQDRLVAGLQQTKTDLTAEYGSEDVATWLHPIHTSKFTSFGAYSADVRPMVNRGSWVQVVSMAEPSRSLSVMPPGNNGLFTAAEFAIANAGLGEPARLTAELDLYWTNTYKPFPLTEAEVDAEAIKTETLMIPPL